MSERKAHLTTVSFRVGLCVCCRFELFFFYLLFSCRALRMLSIRAHGCDGSTWRTSHRRLAAVSLIYIYIYIYIYSHKEREQNRANLSQRERAEQSKTRRLFVRLGSSLERPICVKPTCVSQLSFSRPCIFANSCSRPSICRAHSSISKVARA